MCKKLSTQRSVKLLLPIYIEVNEAVLHSLRWFLKSILVNIDIDEISVIQTSRRFTDIQLIGKDAQMAANFLRRIFGGPKKWEDIIFNEEIPGRVIEIDERNLYVDIGLVEPDYLKVKISFTDIIKKVFRTSKTINKELFMQIGVRRYLPFYVVISDDSKINKEKRTIDGRIGKLAVKMLKKWFYTRFDKLVVYGATRSSIEKALEISGHKRDVLNIERVGFLEHVIVCKWGTSSVGLIPEIGEYLPSAKFVAIRPRYFKKQLFVK